MPSGSHGGGGGSHSSGGSSFGGGGGIHFGGGSGRGYRGTRTFLFFGSRRRLYGFGGILSFFCSILMMFGIFAILGGFIYAVDQSGNIKKIEEDHAYYQDLIDLNYHTTAKVTDMFYKFDKYYITYEIDIPSSTKNLEGYSYCVYTREEAMALMSQNTEGLGIGIISVAVNHPVSEINLKTDSIPLDYKDMSLERDGEYVRMKKYQRNGIIAGCSGIGGIVLAICINLVAVKVSEKKEQKEIEESPADLNENDENKTQPEPIYYPQKTKYCPYCGGKMNADDAKCPSCGSRTGK